MGKIKLSCKRLTTYRHCFRSIVRKHYRIWWKSSSSKKTTEINIVIEIADQPLPVTMESFRPSSGNKQQLQIFFISYAKYIKMTSQFIWVDRYQVI